MHRNSAENIVFTNLQNRETIAGKREVHQIYRTKIKIKIKNNFTKENIQSYTQQSLNWNPWGFAQRKHQSSASLAFVRGIHRWPVDSPHKGPVTRKMFPFDDVIKNWIVHVHWHPNYECYVDLLPVILSYYSHANTQYTHNIHNNIHLLISQASDQSSDTIINV